MSFPIKKIIGKKEIIFSIFFNFIFFDSSVKAAVIFDPLSQYNSVQEVVGGITNWILGVTAGIVILFLIIGGIYYITAAGDQKQIEEAKKIITYAVIGLVVILVSYSIVTTLSKIIFG